MRSFWHYFSSQFTLNASTTVTRDEGQGDPLKETRARRRGLSTEALSGFTEALRDLLMGDVRAK